MWAATKELQVASTLGHVVFIAFRTYRELMLSALPQNLLFNVRDRCHLLDHLGRHAHRNGKLRDISSDYRPSTNSGTLPNSYSGQDNGVASNPAIISDSNSARVFDHLTPGLHFGFVS
jgi:hypothetical protein